MSCNTFSPFPKLGAQYRNGMDYIIGNLPTPLEDATFEQLNDTLADYIAIVLTSEGETPEIPPMMANIIYGILPNAANSYQNANLKNDSFYTEKQVMLFSTITSSIKNNDVEGISLILESAGTDIAQSGLSVADQAPLFAALEVAKETYRYWIEV